MGLPQKHGEQPTRISLGASTLVLLAAGTFREEYCIQIKNSHGPRIVRGRHCHGQGRDRILQVLAGKFETRFFPIIGQLNGFASYFVRGRVRCTIVSLPAGKECDDWHRAIVSHDTPGPHPHGLIPAFGKVHSLLVSPVHLASSYKLVSKSSPAIPLWSIGH